jgi:hypothetical protein
MNYKNILKILLALSVIGFLLVFVVLSPENFGLCKNINDFECLSSFQKQYKFLQYVAMASPFVFFISLFFLSTGKFKEILRTWGKTTIIFWVLSLPFLLSSHGGGLDGNIGGGAILYLLLWIYLLLSVVVIVRKWLNLRGK